MTEKKKLVGNKARLLKKLCELDSKKKEVEKQIKEIKSELGFEPGTYFTSDGNTAKISIQTRSEIPYTKFQKLMKKKRKGKEIPNCVSVKAKEAQKHLSKEEIDGIKKVIASYNKWVLS